jgi:urease accessory protein
MRATARVVAEPDGCGGTRLTVLRSEAPLLLRRTVSAAGPGPGPVPADVHLVGGAAGPLGGDDLLLVVEVRAGAALRLRTVAASLALPGPGGAPSRIRVTATVASGGYLAWLPQPLIAAAGCRHHTESTVDIAPDARLLWREELVCGRSGEAPGDARLSTTVNRGTRPLLAQELAIGPRAPGWNGAAVLDRAGAAGSLLVVEPAWAVTGPPGPRVLGPTAALLPLAGPAVLASVTGADAHQVRAHLDAVAEARWPDG